MTWHLATYDFARSLACSLLFFLSFFGIVSAAQEVAPVSTRKVARKYCHFPHIFKSNQQNISFFWDLDYAWHRQFLFVCLPLNIMPHGWWTKIFSDISNFLCRFVSCLSVCHRFWITLETIEPQRSSEISFFLLLFICSWI